MTVIETLTRDAVLVERAEIEHELANRYGSVDRSELRDASVSGVMAVEDVALVERLRALDFLVHTA